MQVKVLSPVDNEGVAAAVCKKVGIHVDVSSCLEAMGESNDEQRQKSAAAEKTQLRKLSWRKSARVVSACSGCPPNLNCRKLVSAGDGINDAAPCAFPT